MQNIAPCIEMVRKRTGGLAEGTLCYTGDILNPKRTKYTLDYYVRLAKDLENAGAHILGIKDMSGLLKPLAARELIPALRDAVKIPLHLHTHDTSGLQPATYLEAIEGGVDVVDCALGALSGMTSQPSFNSIVEMMRFHRREQPYDIRSLNAFSNYWEAVREKYYPFESGLKAPQAEVYEHEIPGGQYSNLKPQAAALGLADKFEGIKETFADVNDLFGDIVKVTPSSKVVGDMAQFLVANGLTTADVVAKGASLSFPESVVGMMRGDLGQPEGGFPKDVQEAILKGASPISGRPGERLAPVDFDTELANFREQFGEEYGLTDFISYKFYPKVFEEGAAFWKEFGDVSVVPTELFFYGMKPGEEVTIEIARGKTLLIRLLSISEPDEKGHRTVFFKLNGQTRNIDVLDRSIKVETRENRKAEPANKKQVASPLQGRLSKILVKNGDAVKKNQPLFVIEAMKMESTVSALEEGIIARLELADGVLVGTGDLVLEMA